MLSNVGLDLVVVTTVGPRVGVRATATHGGGPLFFVSCLSVCPVAVPVGVERVLAISWGELVLGLYDAITGDTGGGTIDGLLSDDTVPGPGLLDGWKGGGGGNGIPEACRGM